MNNCMEIYTKSPIIKKLQDLRFQFQTIRNMKEEVFLYARTTDN